MASRFRLRLTRNAPGSDATTYGGGLYGDDTYGARADDPANLLAYQIVPDDTSASDFPMLLRREHDTLPVFTCRLISFGSQFEEVAGEVMDLSTVDVALLKLVRVTAGPPTTFNLPMTVDLPTDTLSRTFTIDDTAEPGTYRLFVVLRFDSGRRLTIPADDNITLRVSDTIRERETL